MYTTSIKLKLGTKFIVSVVNLTSDVSMSIFILVSLISDLSDGMIRIYVVAISFLRVSSFDCSQVMVRSTLLTA